MSTKILKHKPLIEAILELRWALSESAVAGMQGDPHYRLLLGRFSERVQSKYQHHEALPTAQFPDEMVSYNVQHQFRVAKAGWPLLQIGPGIMTVNDTDSYTWPDFLSRCTEAVSHLYDSHPSRAEFKLQELTLRYIDAIEFDYVNNNIFDFLRSKLKTQVMLPNSLFEGTDINKNPAAFNWQASFAHNKPAGTVTVRFAAGQKLGSPALIWETLVQSTGDQIPAFPSEFPQWLKDSHVITDDWFFKLIEGELERRFTGE